MPILVEKGTKNKQIKEEDKNKKNEDSKLTGKLFINSFLKIINYK